MVKVLNPLFSNTAHGKLGNIVYQGNAYSQIVRVHVPQRHRPSASQLEWNYKFGVTADNWRVLTEEQKNEYNARAVPFNMTGFNLYIKENIHSV